MKFSNCSNRFSKKPVWIILFLITAFLFLSCQSAEKNTYLEYGQMKWGMSPEKVFELLEVSSEDIVMQEVTESGEYYLLKNVDFCGEKTSQIALNFLKLGYQEDVIKESETVKVWGGPQLSQVLKAETFNQYQELWFLHPMKIEKEVWEKFRKNARLVTGAWVNLSGEGGKVVHFNAYNLAVYKKS